MMQTASELFGKARYSFGRYWAVWFAMALTSCAMVAATMTGIESLWGRWADYPYNHAIVILAMSAWLALDAIRTSGLERLSPSAYGAPGLLLAFAAYLVFEHQDLTLGMQAVLPLILLAITATITGVNTAGRLAFPILFLYFAIPVWDLVIPPLQAMTTAVVGAALRWTGFTAFFEGTLIHVPAGSFEIAEECAGLRYFIVSFALAAFFGLLYLRTWGRGLALLGMALATAILCNWLRVYSLIVIGDLTDMQHYFIAESHARFGWGFYAVSLIPVFFFAIYLQKRQSDRRPRQLPASTSTSSPSHFMTAAILVSTLFAASYFLRQ